MGNKGLQRKLAFGSGSLSIVLLGCLVCWLLTSVYLSNKTSNPISESAVDGFSMGSWVDCAVKFVLYLLMGHLLIELNNRFSVIRLRTSIHAMFFLLLVTVSVALCRVNAGDVIGLLGLLSIFFLFQGYHQPQKVSYLFYSYFFIGLCSLLYPKLSFLVLFWLVECVRFQSLTVRGFCASVLGWLFPYWILLGFACVTDNMEVFYGPFVEMTTFSHFFDFSRLRGSDVALLLGVLAWIIVGICHLAAFGYEDKIRTRAYLGFFVDLSAYLLLLFVLHPLCYAYMLPLLIINASILTGHCLALVSGKSFNILFILLFTGCIVLYGFNIWTLFGT